MNSSRCKGEKSSGEKGHKLGNPAVSFQLCHSLAVSLESAILSLTWLHYQLVPVMPTSQAFCEGKNSDKVKTNM